MPDVQPISPIETYKAAVTANPNSAEAQSNLGWGFYGQHQYDDAIKAFQQALTLDRNLTDAHYGLGLTLKEASKNDEAVAEFEMVVKLAPQDSNAVRGLMLARLARGHISRIKSGDWNLGTDVPRAS